MATSSKDSARDALSLALESQPDMIKEVKASRKIFKELSRLKKRDAHKKNCATVRKEKCHGKYLFTSPNP